MATFLAETPQDEAEHEREEDDGQHVAVVHRGDDVLGDDVDEHVREGLLSRCGRWLDGDDGCHVETHARLAHLCQHDGDDDGQSGGEQVDRDGADADLAEHLRVAHGRGAADDRAEDERYDEHLHETHEPLAADVADALDEDVIGGRAGRHEVTAYESHDDARDKRYEYPRGQVETAGLLIGHLSSLSAK